MMKLTCLVQFMAGQPNNMNYASAGVDIDLEGSAVSSLVGALSKSVRKTGTPGAPVDLPGGFGGIIEWFLICEIQSFYFH